MSMEGMWKHLYPPECGVFPFGGDESYVRAGRFFAKGCRLVEDWGSGTGYFKKFLRPEIKYIPIDGTPNPYITKVLDLEKYQSTANGILLRHVLEHNLRWQKILDNAAKSVRQKLVLIISTPLNLALSKSIKTDEYGISSFSLGEIEIMEHLGGFTVRKEKMESPATPYRVETIFYATKA